MTPDTFDYNGFYTIVSTQHYSLETVQRVLIDCWSLHIVNAFVLTSAMNHTKIFLYSYYPYTPEHCENIDPVAHDYFDNDSFALNVPIFPDEIRDFHKCPLVISTYTLELESLPNGIFHTDGIESRMLMVLAKRLNFKPIIEITSFNIYEIGSTKQSTPRQSLDMVNVFNREIINYN